MKIAKLLCTLALSAGAACVNNAYAVSIQSSVGDYGFRLIDLDPADGVAPSINFTWAFSQSYTNFCGCGGGVGEETNFAYDFPSTVKAGGTYFGETLNSSISPSSYIAYAGSSTAGSVGQVSSLSDVAFTLSANTQVVFYGTAKISQSGYGGETGTLSGATAAGIYLAGESPSETGAELTSFSHSVSGPIAAGGLPYSENFALTYKNTGTTEFFGKVNIGATSVLDVSAVPEPSSYAMLMAGLLLVGGAARRKAGGKSPA